ISYGMPGVWTHAFVDMWSPGYLGFMSTNHNGMLRMYETFGNGGANTMRRTIGGTPGATPEATPATAPTPPLATEGGRGGRGGRGGAGAPESAGAAPAGRGAGMTAREWYR